MPPASPCLAMASHDTSPPAAHLRTPVQFFLCTPADPDRLEVECFIQEVYLRRFGARVPHFMPVLAGLRDAAGIVAAAGYRDAGTAPLYLERYLQAPVETLLAGFQGTVPARTSVVEVGHLAATRAGEGRRLISLLGPHLAQQGFQWVVSTLTEELRRLFVRIGVTPLSLGTADPAALGEEAAHWGSYYEHRPLVLAGHLPQALRNLSNRAGGATP
jgi:Thermostable hemolysin